MVVQTRWSSGVVDPKRHTRQQDTRLKRHEDAAATAATTTNTTTTTAMTVPPRQYSSQAGGSSTPSRIGRIVLNVFFGVLALVLAISFGQNNGILPPNFGMALAPNLMMGFFPLFHARAWFVPATLEAALFEAYAVRMLVPTASFSADNAPPAPDYANPDAWYALGDREDTADVTPPGYSEAQASAKADAFYLHPTTFYSGAAWNAAHDDQGPSFLVSEAILPQQVSPFNGACRIFAPRYRQMTAGGYFAQAAGRLKEGQSALDLAYSDVRRAFEYYLRNWNNGRPIVIVGHSQGTLLHSRLVHDYFERNVSAPLSTTTGNSTSSNSGAGCVGGAGCVRGQGEGEGKGEEEEDNIADVENPSGSSVEENDTVLLRDRLIAAYLVGMQVWDGPASRGESLVPPCDGARDTGCIVSWMTHGIGGQPSLFLANHGLLANQLKPPRPGERPICVNPLNWRRGCEHVPPGAPCSNAHAPAAGNTGALHIYHPRLNVLYLSGVSRWQDRFAGAGVFDGAYLPLEPDLVDARCDNGHLLIEQPTAWGHGWGLFPIWQAFTFPGANYHAYDYNLYWGNVRANAAQRVEAWFAKQK